MQYQDADKRIFRYHDGAGEVHADPLELSLGIMTRMVNADELTRRIKAVKPGSDDLEAVAAAAAATRELVAGIRDVFGLAPFDPKTGAGATAGHALAVWDRFQDFARALKKNTGPSPTTAPPTTPPPGPAATSSTSASS